MKFPWTRRAEHAELRAEMAAQERAEVVQQWDDVRALTTPLNREGQLNGFTALALGIFRGEGSRRRA